MSNHIGFRPDETDIEKVSKLVEHYNSFANKNRIPHAFTRSDILRIALDELFVGCGLNKDKTPNSP